MKANQDFLNAKCVKITKKRLIEILRDTAEDCPENDFAPVDVYSIARELFLLREKIKEESTR